MRRVGLPVAAAMGVILSGLFGSVPVSATAPTALAFDTASHSAEFGSDWMLSLTLSTDYGPVEANSGTVDIYIDGMAGTYAPGITIQPGGRVYFSQPIAQPLLAAGTYSISAIFVPASGSGLGSSQTTLPASLHITPITLQAAISVDIAGPDPIIWARLDGPYVDSAGAPPPGVWTFTVSDPNDKPVFEKSVIHDGTSDEALSITIDSELRRDTLYTVRSKFTVVEELAGGIPVNALEAVTFRSAAGSPLEVLAQPLHVPLWDVIGLVLVPLALAGAVVVVLLRRRQASQQSDDAVTAH